MLAVRFVIYLAGFLLWWVLILDEGVVDDWDVCWWVRIEGRGWLVCLGVREEWRVWGRDRYTVNI